MTMRAALGVLLDGSLYQLEEAREAYTEAAARGGAVYSWKTTGRWNWLERGGSIVDVLALTVLPEGLPEIIDMPDDEIDEEG